MQNNLEERAVDYVAHACEMIAQGDHEGAKKIVLKLHHADIADVLDHVSDEDGVDIWFKSLLSELPPETIESLQTHTLARVLSWIGAHEFAKILDRVDLTDAIDVISRFAQTLRNEVLEYCSQDRSKEIAVGLSYLSKTAGRVMDQDILTLMPHWTVQHSIDFVIKKHSTKRIYSIIVVDGRFKPVGYVCIADLLRANHDQRIGGILKSDIQIVNTNTDLDHLAYIFKQYSLDIVPVVNKLGKLVGSVAIDDMIEIVAKEVEEDTMHLGGIRQTDIFANFVNTIKHRFLWLCLNLVISGAGYFFVITRFSDTIIKVVVLAAVAPIVASMSGNAGTQVITVTVRAIASVGGPKKYFFLKLMNREILVALVNGLLLAPVGGTLIWIMYRQIGLSLVFGAALAINCFLAGVFGCTVPVLLRLCNIDPASSSGVIVTNLTDSLSHLSILILAFCFLI